MDPNIFSENRDGRLMSDVRSIAAVYKMFTGPYLSKIMGHYVTGL